MSTARPAASATTCMNWTEDAIARLRALWDEGHPTAEIGRRMGISKNAVVGKAHRLDLPARKGPVGRGEREPRAPKPAKTRIPTPPLPRVAAVTAGPSPAPRPCLAPVPTRPAAPAPLAPPARRHGTAARHSGGECCWPIGEPGRPGFRFCGQDAMPGRPYCPEHAQAAYVRPAMARDRRDGTRLDRYLRDHTRDA